jgi:hypothetical protein
LENIVVFRNVLSNQDKPDPEAYCAWLEHEITGSWPGEKGRSNMVKHALKIKRRDESLEAFIERVGQAVREYMNKELADENLDEDYPVSLSSIWTFKDSVIVKDYNVDKMYEIKYRENTNGELEFTSINEVEEIYVQKALLKENPRITMKSVFDVMEVEDLDQCYKAIQNLEETDEPDALYSYIHYKVKGDWPTVKIESVQKDTELTAPIVQKNTAQKIAYAAVLVPGEKDYDDEEVTKAKIEQAAHEWMESYRNVDVQHSLNNVGYPVESYILPMDMEVAIKGEQKILPQGSWILASKFNNDDTWKKIENGELTGYSVMGVKRATLETAMKGTNTPDIAYKKTLLRDLGPDWVAIAVSAVDEPCVPKAKFFALKSKVPEKSDTLLDKVRNLFGATKSKNEEDKAAKAGRTISDSTYDTLKRMMDLLSGLIDKGEKERKSDNFSDSLKNNKGDEDEMTEEEVKTLLESLKSDLKKEIVDPLTERIDKVEKSLEKEEDAGKDKKSEKSKKKDDDKGKGEPAKKEKEESKKEDEDITALKAKIEELEQFKEDVAKKLGKTSSKSLKGQDGEDEEEKAEKSRFENRDAYGRSKK